MSTKCFNQFQKGQFTSGALPLAAIVALLTACAPAKRLPMAEIQASQGMPKLSISKDIDMVRLEGVLKTPEQVSQVYSQASALFDAAMVINNIAIDNSVQRAQWIEPMLATAETMKDVNDFSLVAADGQLFVGGSVESAEHAESIADLASDLAGLDLAVSSNLQYPSSQYAELDLNAELLDEQIDLMAEIRDDQLDVAEPGILVEQPAVAVPESASVSGIEELSEVVDLPEAATIPAINPLPEIAAIEPVIAPVATLQSVSVPIEIAVNDPLIDQPVIEKPAYQPAPDIDTDGDGIVDKLDRCKTRSGYPVNSSGCQVLDRTLSNVGFNADDAELVSGSESELNEIAALLQSHPAAKIAVITHALDDTDERSAEARRKAFLVTSYLEERGVARGRVYAFALAPAPGVDDNVLIKEID